MPPPAPSGLQPQSQGLRRSLDHSAANRITRGQPPRVIEPGQVAQEVFQQPVEGPTPLRRVLMVQLLADRKPA